MKKTIIVFIGLALFLTQQQPTQANIELNEKSKQKSEHVKPGAVEFSKETLTRNSKEVSDFSEATKSVTSDNESQKGYSSVNNTDREPSSLAVPTLLDMTYYSPQIIAAAVAKNHRNIQSARVGYQSLYNYYDALGNLDYVNNSSGVMVANVFYCDGSESYACPTGWLDFIDLNPDGIGGYLEFFYNNGDTPTIDYYAAIEEGSEPHMYFFNINMASGTPITNPSDQLYDDANGTRIEYRTDMITGYVDGVTPIDANWILKFNTFSNQRLTNIGNNDNTKLANFTSSPSSSVYRFWSDKKQGHFFTTSAAEKAAIIASDPSWRYESVAYEAVNAQAAQATPIYRFWSDKKQHHFYTASEAEKAAVIANDPSWRYESVAYYAYTNNLPNTTPVYRFWSDKKQGHFYTTSLAEKNAIASSDPSWRYETIAWYVPTN